MVQLRWFAVLTRQTSGTDRGPPSCRSHHERLAVRDQQIRVVAPPRFHEWAGRLALPWGVRSQRGRSCQRSTRTMRVRQFPIHLFAKERVRSFYPYALLNIISNFTDAFGNRHAQNAREPTAMQVTRGTSRTCPSGGLVAGLNRKDRMHDQVKARRTSSGRIHGIPSGVEPGC